MYVFEKLDIYNSAVGFSAIIEKATEEFPASIDYFGERLRRVSHSIHANVAEAHGHWKDEERREFFWKAREGTQECAGLIEIAARQGLLDEKSRMGFRKSLDGLQRMIQDALHHTDEKEEKSSPVTGPFNLKVL